MRPTVRLIVCSIMRASAAGRVAALLSPLVLAACNGEAGVGYVEIKTVSAAPALYLDTVKLEPLRNGTAFSARRSAPPSCRSTARAASLLCSAISSCRRTASRPSRSRVSSRLPRCQCGATASPPRRRPTGPAWRREHQRRAIGERPRCTHYSATSSGPASVSAVHARSALPRASKDGGCPARERRNGG